MNNTATNTATCPTVRKQIGKTTYIVRVHHLFTDPRGGAYPAGVGHRAVGLSLQSHDPSQRSQGFLTLAGGLVITFAKEILDLITA